MEGNPQSSGPQLVDALKVIAIPIAGGLGALVHRFLDRKKQKPEISVLDATADKTRADAELSRATAERTRAEGRKYDSEILAEAWDRINHLLDANQDLRCEVEDWKKKAEKRAIAIQLNEVQIKRMKNILELNEIHLSDYDKPKE